ncbi:hypothetical protein [Thauera sp.]|jgi:hypothetical protein|uniref:hypothetical protein n=1 Tax=Thauera sp. TaxID=1905334 RepID=UPI002A364F0E|nr:hypothetical protein [Thauera sp.]MDX9885751.1 hypothetical protein [Thauera sp.]
MEVMVSVLEKAFGGGSCAERGAAVFLVAVADDSGDRRTAANMLHRNINKRSLAGFPRTSIRTFGSIT